MNRSASQGPENPTEFPENSLEFRCVLGGSGTHRSGDSNTICSVSVVANVVEIAKSLISLGSLIPVISITGDSE